MYFYLTFLFQKLNKVITSNIMHYTNNTYILIMFTKTMQETLEKLAIQTCMNLPLRFTIYEENGVCKNPNEQCDHCKRVESELYLCTKRTYTSSQELLPA